MLVPMRRTHGRIVGEADEAAADIFSAFQSEIGLAEKNLFSVEFQIIFGSGGESCQAQIVRDSKRFRMPECFRENQFSLVFGIEGNQTGIERAVKIRRQQQTVLRVQPFGIVRNAPRFNV